MSERASDSSSDSWKIWLAAGVGAAVLALGGIALFRSTAPATKKKKKNKTKKEEKQETKPEESKEKSQPKVNLPDDDTLFQTLVTSIIEMQQSGDISGGRETQLLLWLHNMTNKYDKYVTRTRLLAAQWLILFYTLKNMTARNAEEFKQAVDAQNVDMVIAWELLDCESTSNEEVQALDLLRLDVCQRLKDHRKMAPVFDRVIARGNDMTYEDIMVAFTTAPLLGRWSAVRQLGARIIEQQGSLEDFHKAALQRPDIPDFEVLYNMAEEEAKQGDTPQDQFSWSSYLIKSMRIRLRNVQCEDESKVEKVRSAFDPDGNGSWKTIPVSGEATKLVRFGAIAQMLSLSTVPIPMVGPATNDRIKVLGYLVLSPPTGVRMKQTESYSIRRTAPNSDQWTGEYTLTQEKANSDSSTPNVKVTFDMEMALQQIDS